MSDKKLTVAIIVMGLWIAAAGMQSTGSAEEVSNGEEDAYIVVVDDAAETEQVLSVVGDTDCIFMEGNVISVSMTEEEAEKLAQSDEVEIVEKDIDIVALGEEQACADVGTEWNMQMIHADSPKQGADNEKIKVAVIDSGINYSDDINVVERRNFVEGDDKVSVLYEDGSGHGTAIAGIIAAMDNGLGITGVAPGVDIYSARVLDDQNHASLSRVIAAVEWAMEKDVNIINLSLGCMQNSEALHNILKKAKQQGILVIAAAGNGGDVMYPAAYDEVVAVASVGTDGIISENSSTGSQVELVAPGEQILSTGMFDGMMTCGGSSMAAAHVTGVAAALWQQDAAVSSEFIRKLMNVSARGYNDEEVYGYGLVDLKNAYKNYEDIKSSYEEGIDADELADAADVKENDAVINTYDDITYVEGLWTFAQHQALADQGVFSGSDLAVIKIGALANDKYIQGMTAHPRWHGYFITENNVTVNYAACYIYLTRIAKNIVGSAGAYTADSVSGADNDCSKMSGVITPYGVNGTSWSTILSGYSVNQRNEQLAVYGMALHIVSDVFAHSAYKNNVRIKHTTYDEDGVQSAHSTKVCPNRYTCAAEIARTVLARCSAQSVGAASDFIVGSYNGEFQLKNIADNILAIDSGCYSAYSAYLISMDVDRN